MDINILKTKISYNIFELFNSSPEHTIILFKKNKRKYKQNFNPQSVINYELYKLELKSEEENIYSNFPVWGLKTIRSIKEHYKKILAPKNNYQCSVCDKEDKPSNLFIHHDNHKFNLKQSEESEYHLTCIYCHPLMSNISIKRTNKDNFKLLKNISIYNRGVKSSERIPSLQYLLRDENKKEIINKMNRESNKREFIKELSNG